MLHALALLLPRPLRRLACRVIGHLWQPLAHDERPARGFRQHRRAVVTIHARCGLCERETIARMTAGPVRA